MKSKINSLESIVATQQESVKDYDKSLNEIEIDQKIYTENKERNYSVNI